MGLLGSSPFTLVGDPDAGNLLPTGELTLDGLTGEAPAGIGVLESGPIASGNQVAVVAGDVSPSVPVTVCGHGAGVLGDASASCDTGQAPAAGSGSTGTGSAGTSAGTGSSAGDSLLDGLASGNQVDAGIGDISPSIPLTVCGNGVGVAGDASAACGSDTSTGGIIAPPPEEPGGTDTGTSGIPGTQGSTGTSGLIATGLTPGSSGGAGDPVASFAPLRPLAAGSGALPFTGAASDLLAVAGAALLAAGLLVVRATRPDTARKGGGDR